MSLVNGFLNWWDGVELWLSGLAFVLQALVVMPVVLALAYVTAVLLDGLLGKGIQLMRRSSAAPTRRPGNRDAALSGDVGAGHARGAGDRHVVADALRRPHGSG